MAKNTRTAIEVVKLHKDGLRGCDIALKVGCTRQNVNCILKKRKLKSNYATLVKKPCRWCGKLVSYKVAQHGEGKMSCFKCIEKRKNSKKSGKCRMCKKKGIGILKYKLCKQCYDKVRYYSTYKLK